MINTRSLLTAALSLVLASCTDLSSIDFSDSLMIAGSPPSGGSVARAAMKTESRSGLGTKAGNWNRSVVESASFHRKPTGQPDAVDSFHYDDEAGARAMVGESGSVRERGGAFDMAGGRLRVSLRDLLGDDFRRLEVSHPGGVRRVAMGHSGYAYGIHLKNRSGKRIEVVVSVDGLDVIDGQPANLKKRGYILAPGQEYTIRGFRLSNHSVRQFMFGSVSQSEAAGKGQARNVGVIGFGVFEEDEVAAKTARLREALIRTEAQPFH